MATLTLQGTPYSTNGTPSAVRGPAPDFRPAGGWRERAGIVVLDEVEQSAFRMNSNHVDF